MNIYALICSVIVYSELVNRLLPNFSWALESRAWPTRVSSCLLCWNHRICQKQMYMCVMFVSINESSTWFMNVPAGMHRSKVVASWHDTIVSKRKTVMSSLDTMASICLFGHADCIERPSKLFYQTAYVKHIMAEYINPNRH